MRIVDLKRTRDDGPVLWEGKSDSGQEVLIRFRSGYLQIFLDGFVSHSCYYKFGSQLDDYTLRHILKNLWSIEI